MVQRKRRSTFGNALTLLVLLVVVGVAAPTAGAHDAPSALAEIQKRGTLRIGWAVVFPYMYRDPKTNELTGFSVDFANQLGEALNAKVRFVEDSWATMIAGLQADKFDVTIAAVAATLPRAQVVTFTDPVARQPLGLLIRAEDASRYKDWTDLDEPGKRITTTLGSNIDMFSTRRFQHADIVRVKAGPESIAQLLTGKADAWANSLEAFRLIRKERPELVVVPGETFGASPITMALRQGDFVFRDWLNLFIQEQKATGNLAKLLEKYGLYEWTAP